MNHADNNGKIEIYETVEDSEPCFLILELDFPNQSIQLASCKTQEMAETLCKGMGWEYDLLLTKQ